MPPRRPTTARSPDLFGPIVETTIERIVPGGYGLAHAAGRTIFVTAAAPGDRARVRIERTQGTIAHASVVDLLEPSPDRVTPPHPELTHCGGADFQHLRYEAQLAAKVEIVRDSLRRIGGIDPPADLPIIPSPAVWGYRARAEWRHDPERRALGYVEQGSHRVCDLPTDPFVVPALAATFADLRDRLAAGTLPRAVAEFRAAAGDGQVSLAPPLAGGEPAPIATTVAGERLAYDADCFFQVNPGVLAPLVEEAVRLAVAGAVATASAGEATAHTPDRLAIDLYCGVGLFTLPLARRFGRVIGVEAHPRTAAYARRNAADAERRNVRIETAPAEDWLEGAYRSHGRVPFVLLDPPRTGLAPAALRGLLRLRPGRIAYVACDPATLARDLKALVAGGYALVRIVALDMFPQTHHVETVAHLARAR